MRCDLRHMCFSRRPRSLTLRSGELLESRCLMAIVVDTLLDERDGSLADGDVSLRDALESASANDAIEFAPQLNGGTIALTLGELWIAQPLTIDATALSMGLTLDASTSDPTPLVFDGNGSRAIRIDDGVGDCAATMEVAIRGLTITGGDITGEFFSPQGRGGGILSCESLTLTKSEVRSNSSGRTAGGGIFGTGTLTLIETRVVGNLADHTDGAGAYVVGAIIVNASEIRDNLADHGAGGGVFATESAEINDSTISGNLGGGVFARRVTITDSRIRENRIDDASGNGAGVSGIELRITHSDISGNSMQVASGAGAGIWGQQQVTVIESSVDNDFLRAASGRGAGIAGNGVITVINSSITRNGIQAAGADGGGINGPTVDIFSSTISNNYAGRNQGKGGGIYGTQISLHHTSLVENIASSTRGLGGGIFVAENGTIELDHTVLARNSATDHGNDVHFVGTPVTLARYSLIGDGSTAGLTATGLVTPDLNGNLIGGIQEIDPMLGALALNGVTLLTHSPLLGSPLINAGDPQGVAGALEIPMFDQRGTPFTRVNDGRIDIGAIEFQPLMGDIDEDGEVGISDIDLICAAIVKPPADRTPFDLTDDGNVDTADLDLLLHDVLQRSPGDVNLDGVFDSLDLVLVFQKGEYEDLSADNSRWSEGDWNCDGDFTSADLVFALQLGPYTAE